MASKLTLNTPNGAVNLVPEDGSGSVDVTIPRAGFADNSGKILGAYQGTLETVTIISDALAHELCYVEFTTSAANSKFLVSTDVRWNCTNPNRGFGIYRDGSTLLGNNPTDAYGDGWMGVDESTGGNSDWEMDRDHHQWLDSPGLAAGTTVRFSLYLTAGSGGTFYINRASNSGGPTSIAAIQVLEIAN